MKLEEEYQISVTGPYHTERAVCFLVECSKKGGDGDLVRESALTLWLPSSFAENEGRTREIPVGYRQGGSLLGCQRTG